MVRIVVLGASPEWQEVVQAEWQVVTTVRIDGLEKTKDDPDVHSEDVEVTTDGSPHNGYANRAETKDHNFDGRGVLGGHTEGCRVLVVNLVNMLVEWTPVKSAMRPVMP